MRCPLCARYALRVTGAVVVLGAVAWGAWYVLSPRPSLEPVAALFAAKQFDEAAARLTEYLRVYPSDESAHYLGAQLALDRPEPGEADARRALVHLDKIRSRTRDQAALVMMNRGKARLLLDDLDGAEAAWTTALELDPTVPEAGWYLLDLYYFQWRGSEAIRLALRLHAIEPDARDRVRFLTELVRQDLQRLKPRYVVQWFEPKVRHNPTDMHASLALGRALVLDARIDEGLALLRRVVDAHPDAPEAWDALLSGLDEGGAEAEAWDEAFARLPKALASDPRFARHRGRVAQDRLDWPAAAAEYRRALELEPDDKTLVYRLGRVLRNTGAADEAGRIEKALQEVQNALPELAAAYREVAANSAFGAVPDIRMYRRLAALRERMSRRAEALAWHRLVLRSLPDDPASRAAVERLAQNKKGPEAAL